MGEEDKPPSLDELGERLRAAREHRGAHRQRKSDSAGGPGGMTGLGWALRVGVEMVSALAVGVGVGLLLDRWLGTGPWLLVVFFLLGAGAAILNVYRAAMGYGLAVGYKKPGEDGDEEENAAKKANGSDATTQPKGKKGER